MRCITRRVGLVALLLVFSGVRAEAGPVVEDYKARNVLGFATTGRYDPRESYKVGGASWVAELCPLRPEDLVRGGTANFLAVLRAAFPVVSGWTFAAAAVDLSNGSLKVHSYDVQGSATRVGIQLAPGIGFDVEYVPGVNDPTVNMHWIQVVTDNHNITNNPGHGNAENIVDNPFSPGGRAPYYDDGGAADSRNFLDAPARSDGGAPHKWVADLYLVSGPAANAPGAVTIYNGIRWGWSNRAVPEPSTLLSAGAGIFVLVVAMRRRTARAA